MKLLITGFDPFDSEVVNPSYEAVRRLPDAIAGAELAKLEIPTVFSRCGPALEAGIRAHQPDAVLCVGQAGGQAHIAVERVGINLIDARIPDNAGLQPVDVPVRPDGPAAYFSTLPVKAIVRRIRDSGIPCRLSCSAGTYVCNCLLYQALHMAALRYPHIRVGFIHVPFSDEQAAAKPGGTPGLPLAVLTQALALAAEAIAENPQDIHESMGSIY